MNFPKFFGFGKDKGPEPQKPMKREKAYSFDMPFGMANRYVPQDAFDEERAIVDHARDERNKRKERLPIDELFTKEQQVGQAVLDEIGSKKEVTAR